MLLDVLHQLGLDVRLPRDGDGLLHERLVEVHLVQLQFQLLGDLREQGEKRIRGKQGNRHDFARVQYKAKSCGKGETFGSNVAKNLTKGWNSSAASSYSMKSEWKRRKRSKQTDRTAVVDEPEAPAWTYGEISGS